MKPPSRRRHHAVASIFEGLAIGRILLGFDSIFAQLHWPNIAPITTREVVPQNWTGREGWCVGRKRASRLMRKMGRAAIYQAPRPSTPHPEHRIYPYLLRGLTIDQPNQV